MNIPYFCKPKKLIQTGGGLLIMLTAVCLEPYDVIDGVTAASVLHPTAVPNIQLSTPSGAPQILNNTVTTAPGQKVTINLVGSDPNGFNGYVYACIVENQVFYPPNTQGLTLPKGATFKQGANNTKAIFTWTPPSTATSSAPVVITFGIYNTYGSTNFNQQTVTLKSIDTTGPSFAPSMKPQDTVYVGVPVTFPVVVNPDTDKDKVLIASTNLPTGATLTTPAKNSKGQWVSNMNWTPTIDQLGQSNVTFTAQDVNETQSIPNFTTNFTVLNVTTPAFDASMPTQKNAPFGKALTYKIILTPDPHTHHVLISATGLPPKAVLSAPTYVNGQVHAHMTWTPTKSELNNNYAVTFTAEDNLAGAQAVNYDVMFTVTSK